MGSHRRLSGCPITSVSAIAQTPASCDSFPNALDTAGSLTTQGTLSSHPGTEDTGQRVRAACPGSS